jgi:integrase
MVGSKLRTYLHAYSGARISEVCQLRVEDIQERSGAWHMHFAAEAGSLKNENSERAVPIHSALIERGFLSFVKQAKSGPLFVAVRPDRFGNRGGNGTKVLSRWIRALGMRDVRISPSHSWRHRFKTLGRRHGLAPDIVDAITGHGKKTVADNYGAFEDSALRRELEKIPSTEVISTYAND